MVGTISSMRIKRTEVVRDFPGIGARVREARERAVAMPGRSLTKICKEAGISRQYWYQIENENLTSPVGEDTIRKIESVLGIDLGVRFDG